MLWSSEDTDSANRVQSGSLPYTDIYQTQPTTNSYQTHLVTPSVTERRAIQTTLTNHGVYKEQTSVLTETVITPSRTVKSSYWTMSGDVTYFNTSLADSRDLYFSVMNTVDVLQSVPSKSVYNSNVVVNSTASESELVHSNDYFTSVIGVSNPPLMDSAFGNIAASDSTIIVRTALESVAADSSVYYPDVTKEHTTSLLFEDAPTTDAFGDIAASDSTITMRTALEYVAADSSVYYADVTNEHTMSLLFEGASTIDMTFYDATLSPSFSPSGYNLETSFLDAVETSSMVSYVAGLSSGVVFSDSISVISMTQKILTPSPSFSESCSDNSNYTCAYVSSLLTVGIEASSVSLTDISASLYTGMDILHKL